MRIKARRDKNIMKVGSEAYKTEQKLNLIKP